MGDTLFNPKQCFTRCFVVISVVIIFQISPGCVKLNHAGGDCIEPKKRKMNDIFANKTNAIWPKLCKYFTRVLSDVSTASMDRPLDSEPDPGDRSV